LTRGMYHRMSLVQMGVFYISRMYIPSSHMAYSVYLGEVNV